MASPGPQQSVEVDVVDRLLSALSSRQNRAVLRYLRESSDGVASLAELADHLVDGQDGTGRRAADPGGSGTDSRRPETDSEPGEVHPGRPETDSGHLETDPGRRGGDAGGRERVVVRLHHSSLPTLAATGVVDYDSRTNTVRYRGHPVVDQCSALLAEVE